MSYEGHEQLWCPKGHYYVTPDNHYGSYDQKCPSCGAAPKVMNPVNDTNCDSWGALLPVVSVPAVVQTCNLGHEHVIVPARYKIPTKKQLLIARKKGSYPPGRCEQCGHPQFTCLCAKIAEREAREKAHWDA